LWTAEDFFLLDEMILVGGLVGPLLLV